MADSAVMERMKQIVAEKLGVSAESITPSSSLRHDLGMDSFSAVEILFEIEEAFKVSVPQDDVAGIETFGDMAGFVEKLTGDETAPVPKES